MRRTTSQWPTGRPRTGTGIDWDAVPLGKVPDAEIARGLRCTDEAVRRARKSRGIPAADHYVYSAGASPVHPQSPVEGPRPVRVSAYVTVAQARSLNAAAKARGVTLAELVRRALAAELS